MSQLHRAALTVEPDAFVAGYRPSAKTLFLPAFSDAAVGGQVSARVTISGTQVRATLLGKILGVRRVGRPSMPPGADILVDPLSLPAAEFLARAAKGEPFSFKERAPRFIAQHACRIVRDTSEVDVKLHNVSEGGCFVMWGESPLPLVGEVVLVKLGDGMLSPSSQGIVCWNSPGGGFARGVGLRVAPRGRAAKIWKEWIAEAARNGAVAA